MTHTSRLFLVQNEQLIIIIIIRIYCHVLVIDVRTRSTVYIRGENSTFSPIGDSAASSWCIELFCLTVWPLGYSLMKGTQAWDNLDFFLPKSNPHMPLVNFRKKFRIFFFDFRQNFEVWTFSRWLSIRGIKFFWRDIHFFSSSKCSLWSF
jgi:hypothetical protein